MPLTAILFNGLILLSALLYYYSNWKLTRPQTLKHLSTPTSPVEKAKGTKSLLYLLAIRNLSPLFLILGIIWGFLWIWIQKGLFSFTMWVFLSYLSIGYLLLKACLWLLLAQLLRKMKANLSEVDSPT